MNYKDIKEINDLINEYYESELNCENEVSIFDIDKEVPLAYSESDMNEFGEIKDLQVSTVIYKKELRFSVNGVLAIKEQYELDDYKKMLKEITYDNLISSFY